MWFASIQYGDLCQVADESPRIFDEAQSIEAEWETNVSALQAQFETLKLQISEKEKSVAVIQAQYYEAQSVTQKKEMEIQELRFEIEQARRNEQMTGNILQEQEARRELLQRDQSQLDAQVEALKEESETLTLQYNEKNEIFQNSQSRI